jgi:hypothetical protein
MLPNAQDAPASAPQGLVHQPVARAVPLKFFPPEGPVVFGLGRVPGAAVPEAAVHKDRQADLGKNEVGFAKDGLIPPPAGEAVASQRGGQRQLGIPVSVRANARHYFGPLGFGIYVGHLFNREDRSEDYQVWRDRRKAEMSAGRCLHILLLTHSCPGVRVWLNCVIWRI